MPGLRVARADVRRDGHRQRRAYDSVGLKVRHGEVGKAKPYLESFHGDDYHRDSGEWRQVSRVVDRDHDRYTERMADEGGHVVREVDEPLRQHTGRGAAKPRPPKHPEA